LGGPIVAWCVVLAVATRRRLLSTAFVDISLERILLPRVAAGDGADSLRDDALGLDDSIAVVTECFHCKR